MDSALTGSRHFVHGATQHRSPQLPSWGSGRVIPDQQRVVGCAVCLPLHRGLSESADLEIRDTEQGQCGQALSSRLSPRLYLVDDFSEESSFYEILPCCARFRCGELVVEGQWHHLALLMSRGMLKNSTAALYIDGQLVSTVKVSALPR